METNNNFNDTIEKLKKEVDRVDDTTRKMEAEETGTPVNKDEKNDNPSFVLYDAIANSSIELLKNPAVINTLKKLTDVLGEDTSKNLVEMLVIIMTQSAYQAIIFYDALLKKELDVQFNHFAENINYIKSDTVAHSEVLKVFKKQLGEIQNKIKLEDFKNNNHVTSDPSNH